MPLPPGFTEVPQQSGGPPVGFQEDQPQSIPEAVKQAIIQHLSRTRDELTLQGEGPVNMAKALPAVAGAAGAVLPVPGGATMGTAGGHAVADAALASIGRQDQVPSIGSQVLDTGIAALGDATAIPALKKASAGKAIGEAEKAAGVVTRAPLKLPTAGNVGSALDELETSLKASLANPGGPIMGPQSAKDAYAVANYVAGNPNIVGKSNEIAVQAARVRGMAQAAMNAAIPGRAAPAAEMASAMTIPNAITRTYQKLPGPVKFGLGASAGASPAVLAYELGKKIVGGGR